MKTLVLGIGAVGSVIATQLAKEEQTEVVCASNNLEEAVGFLQTKKLNIRLMKVDASNPKEIEKAAQGINLIINASPPNFNTRVMEAALRVGAHYQDLCSNLKNLKTPEQLKFNEKFEKAKLIGLINTGIAPGVTNLLAREISEKFDETLEIRIRLLEHQQGTKFFLSWSPQVILDESVSPPLTYKNGRFKLLEPFAEIEEYKFPKTFGKKCIFTIYGDEVSTIPLYIKTRNVNFKCGGEDIEAVKALYDLGVFNREAIYYQGKKIVPLKFFSKILPGVPKGKEMMNLINENEENNAAFVSVVEGVGKKDGKKMMIKKSVSYPDLRQIAKKFSGATHISYPTGIAAVAFSKAIQKIDNYGVFPPEALESDVRSSVLKELERYKIFVKTNSKK